MLEVAGEIAADTLWHADLVRVIGDVRIRDEVTLTIYAGARVEFQDFYHVAVQGTLVAEGTAHQPIVFTTDEPELFSVDGSTAGCWNGIRFEGTAATNAHSRLTYCVLEYSKAVSEGYGNYPYGGGAISVIDCSGLTVDNCILRHNVADFGGAIFLYRNASPTIASNLITQNHALRNASALYSAYSCPRLINNTIVHNTIHNMEQPYVETAAGLSFLGKPAWTNNIIRDNEPVIEYIHTQLLHNKLYYTDHNNIAGHVQENGNIDTDPMFMDPDGLDDVLGTGDDNFRLQPGSPCIDVGRNDALPSCLLTDLDGLSRAFDGDVNGDAVVDLGAYESGDCNANDIADIQEILDGDLADCNENLLPDTCELDLFGAARDCNANAILDECEIIAAGDYNNDGIIDAVDFAVLTGLLAGPGYPPAASDEQCTAFALQVLDFDGDGDVDLLDFAAFSQLPGP